MYQSSYNTYTQTSANTNSKIGLIIMLYDGAIRFISLAVHHMNQKNFYEKTQYINKTCRIIEELQGSLDYENGGEIARNLNNLYSYLTKELLSASLKNNIDSFNRIIKMLNDIKKSWEEVEKKQSENVNIQSPSVSHSSASLTV